MKHFSSDFIRSCKKGNRGKQKELFESLYAPMYRVCFRYLAHQPDAEDCLMKGFMRMFQGLEAFEFAGEHSLFVWVRRIMVNESLMELRKRNSFYMMPEEVMAELPAQQEILEQMHAEELYAIILDLPTGYRTVLNLFVVEGYSHKEIGEMLGITESTSKTQYMKAKQRLKSMVEQNGWSYGRLGK